MNSATQKPGVDAAVQNPDDGFSSGDERISEADERKLVRKLDLYLIPLVMALYVFSFLDSMEADLGLVGTQYQTAVSILFITYLAFEVPSNLVLKKFTPSRWIAFITVTWGIIATLTGLVNNYGSLLACRLLLGVVEAGLFPGLTVYLTFFYTKNELALRVGFLFVSAAIAGALGGLLAYGIGHMDGLAGFHGWRWIMIIEGLPTVCLGITSFFLLPNDAESAYFLNEREKKMMIVRHSRGYGMTTSAREFSKDDMKKAFGDWRVWVFCVAQFGADTMLYGFSTFLPTIINGLGKWTTPQVQLLTIPCYFVGALVYMPISALSDRLQMRGIMCVIFGSISVIGYSVLISPSSAGLHYFGCFLVAMGFSPLPVVPDDDSGYDVHKQMCLHRTYVAAEQQSEIRQTNDGDGDAADSRKRLRDHGPVHLPVFKPHPRRTSDEAPFAIKEGEIKNQFGRKVAIDAYTSTISSMSLLLSPNHIFRSMSIYSFLIAVRSNGEQLTNENGDTTSHLMGMFYRTLRMVDNGIKPLYVFDGAPPKLKSGELAKRFQRKQEANEGLEEAKETGTAEDIEKFSRRTVRVTREHNADCQQLLKVMGIPYIIAPTEAEAQCAVLARAGKVYAAASEDMDTLCFNTPILLRHLTFSEQRKEPIQEIHLDKVLEGLNMERKQFVDLCILLGCDYLDPIPKVGPTTALKLIREHGTLEKVVEYMKNDENSKYTIPDDWPYEDARDLFFSPDVRQADDPLCDFKWEKPDMDGLVKFLVHEKGFSEDRVRAGGARLEKNLKSSQQSRIEGFFKLLPKTEEEKKAHKRKLEEQNEAKKKKVKDEKKEKAKAKAKPRGA
ncbi:DNA-repair protein rad2 [Podospora appendiculata]|uniref:Flap endonuclease 1 n=1 Tax=Podospora appendiculata TaxID=314037 RepID=A0AAE0XBG8_9PEZI|nr:DNA-repair protein rad2 [Podospora appendiculata]